MAAAVNGQGPAFQVGAVRPLFNPRMRDQNLGAPYDVSADGQRFLVNTLTSDESKDAAPPITLLVNWTAGLKK